MRKAAAIYLYLTVGGGKWEETLKYIPDFALRTTATYWTSFSPRGIDYMKSWVQLVCAMQWSSVKALLPEYKNSLSKLAWDDTLMVPEATLAKYMPHAGRKAALFKMPAATMPDTDGAGALPATVPPTAAPACSSSLCLSRHCSPHHCPSRHCSPPHCSSHHCSRLHFQSHPPPATAPPPLAQGRTST